MNQKVYELIDSYREKFTGMLREWVSIPSVKAESEPDAPFGTEVRKMLNRAMADARSMGFAVRDFDGYACDITLGEADEKIAVLGHLDVVPVGDGWTKPPFDAVIENGRMYGRGTNDDKGPSLAAMFAMLINTEKGMLLLELRAPAEVTGLKVLELSTGDRINVIPGECCAMVEGGEELVRRAEDYAQKTGLPYKAEVVGNRVMLTAYGIPGHSAYPEGRRNAIGMMLLLLRELGAEGPIATLAEAVGLESDGKSLGCACRDEISEGLTCNMGILRLQNGAWYGTLDMRCPVTADQEKLKEEAIAHLPGISVSVSMQKPPHHVPEDSELIRCLLAAYEEETGLKGKGISTGGGTYAKVLKQGVAFGALFPDEEDLAHQADEYEDIDRLMLAMKIYANALIRLAAE